MLFLIFYGYSELHSVAEGKKSLIGSIFNENIYDSFRNRILFRIHDYEREKQDLDILLKNKKTTHFSKIEAEYGIGNDLTITGNLEKYNISIKSSFDILNSENSHITYVSNVLYIKPFMGLKKSWKSEYFTTALQFGLTPVIFGYNIKGRFSNSSLNNIELLYARAWNSNLFSKQRLDAYAEFVLKFKYYWDNSIAFDPSLTFGYKINSNFTLSSTLFVEINEKSYTPEYLLLNKAKAERFFSTSNNEVIKYNAKKIADKISDFSELNRHYNLVKLKTSLSYKIAENKNFFIAFYAPLNVPQRLKSSSIAVGYQNEF